MSDAPNPDVLREQLADAQTHVAGAEVEARCARRKAAQADTSARFWNSQVQLLRRRIFEVEAQQTEVAT